MRDELLTANEVILGQAFQLEIVGIQALHWPALGSSTAAAKNTPNVHVLLSMQALTLACPWGPGRPETGLAPFPSPHLKYTFHMSSLVRCNFPLPCATKQ